MTSYSFGTLVISLDFELMWGILDHEDPMDYRENILGVQEVIPQMLDLFEKHDIHATWATVGMIAHENMDECVRDIPSSVPNYENSALSPYLAFGRYAQADKALFFSSDLIRRIISSKGQELGSHTYSHYYCVEEGQTKESFSADTAKFFEIMKGFWSEIRSIVFPRNQFNSNYSDVLKKYGIINYRGNEQNWFNSSVDSRKAKSLPRRIVRLLDNYISLSGANCYDYSEIIDENGLNNIRASRFFRPYSRKFAFFEPVRLHRIKKQMKYAAKHNEVFHIWWHPHNFGADTKKNLENLSIILSYYDELKDKYGMKSLNMSELGELIG